SSSPASTPVTSWARRSAKASTTWAPWSRTWRKARSTLRREARSPRCAADFFRSSTPWGARSERREHREHVVVGRNLPLLDADRVVPDDAIAIDDEHGRALAQAHQFVGNVVGVEHLVIGVGEDCEGITVVAYETGDTINGVRRDCENGRARL